MADTIIKIVAGVEAVTPIAVTSTIGRGPDGTAGEKGDQGDPGPQGLKGDKGDQGDAGDSGIVPVVLVAAVDWPPATPEVGTLYLKGA